MVRGAIEKTTGLLMAGVILLLSLVYVPDWSIVGISKGPDIFQRLGYSFFHVSFIHAALNAWCFLSIIFLFEISWKHILAAYIIALAVPDLFLDLNPTVGLSTLCFALLGMVLYRVRYKIYFTCCMALYISFGFLFQSINGWIHLYGFLLGLLAGLLVTPFQCRRKSTK